MNTKYRADPKIVGPGKWDDMHMSGIKAVSVKNQLKSIELIKEICENFGCEVCHNHCIHYIKNHDPSLYVGKEYDIEGQKLRIGIFVWSWEFHNDVNRRLNKETMDFMTAFHMYSDSKCHTVCGL